MSAAKWNRTLVAALLGLLLAVGGLLWFSFQDRIVVIGVSRGLGTLEPPYQYEADLSRMLGFVLEPLCKPVARAPFFGMDGVALSCEIENGGVRVTPRSGISAKTLQEGLARYREGATTDLVWKVPALDGATLWIEPVKDTSAETLLRDLMSTPITLGADTRGFPLGSGPYRVGNVWRGEGDTLLAIPGLSPGIDYTDQVVLQRKSIFPLGSLREIVFLGMHDPSVSEVDLGPQRQALDHESIHFLWSFTADQELAWRSAERPDRWYPSPLAGRGALVASLNPDALPRLSKACSARLLASLRYIASDAAFLKDSQLRPAAQILPLRFPILYVQPRAALPEAALSVCDVTLLTNHGWTMQAQALGARLETLGFTVKAEITDPESQLQKERENHWHIQLLSYLDQGEPPSVFLYSNFSNREWYEGFKDEARGLYDQDELASPEALTSMMAKMSDSNVALGLVTSHYAVNARLVGFKPRGYAIGASELNLRRPGETWIPIGGLAFFLVALGAMFYVDLRVRRAAEERAVLEALMQVYHHELSSPLTTIRAWGESLEESQPRAARVLLRESDAALDMVDRSWWFFSEGGLRKSMERASVDLETDVLRPALERLADLAAVQGISGEALRVETDLPPGLPRAALSVEAGLYVARNLFDNALKYRKPGRLHLKVLCEATPEGLLLRVQDHGLGLDDHISEKSLYRIGFRTDEARSLAVGSGVGLGIVRSVLRAAGGDIRLTRRRDPTEFTLRLRRANPNDPEAVT